MNFLMILENSGLAAWVRESPSIWAYPSIIFLHSAGLAVVVGLSAVIDLAILGFAPGLELAPMKKLFRFMAGGFWMSLVSGFLLTIADATTMLVDPIFWIKMTVIGLALADVWWVKRTLFRQPLLEMKHVTSSARFLAVASLVLWTAAITTGRLTAYLGAANARIGLF
jgi:hypothetical protein